MMKNITLTVTITFCKKQNKMIILCLRLMIIRQCFGTYYLIILVDQKSVTKKNSMKMTAQESLNYIKFLCLFYRIDYN